MPLSIKSGTPKPLAQQPCLDQALAIFRLLQIAKSGNEHFVNWKIASIKGKTARREKVVVKQICAGTVASHDKNRTLVARNLISRAPDRVWVSHKDRRRGEPLNR